MASCVALTALLAQADSPQGCTKVTPTVPVNCSLTAGLKDPNFAEICMPGGSGHAGGAEPPTDRCPDVNYTKGSFRCSCCGTSLFYAKNKYDAMTGWPAFHGEPVKNITTNSSNVCTPGGTEVVCSVCGAHLGDYFDDQDHFCIDGVCLMPPNSSEVCPPGPGDLKKLF